MLKHKHFPLRDRNGVKFEILRNLRTLHEYDPGEWDVTLDTSSGQFAARVCAMRKSHEAAQRAKNQLMKAAKKKGRSVAANALAVAEYDFVLTTVPQPESSAANVLDLYRSRGQIELAFKRLKSLLHAGHVPKYDPASARAWIQAKLLIERLTEAAGFFPPGVSRSSLRPQPMA